MTLAAIDIGTKTVLLLIVEVSEEGTLHSLLSEQRIPRLGRGVDRVRALHEASVERVIAVLKEYQELCAPYRPESTVVCATSAVRDAANRVDFINRVRAETGLEIEVLSGEAEALWTYRGAIRGASAGRRSTVLDIGGGSTEIITGDRDAPQQRVSIDIGSVRLTERYLLHDPPSTRELSVAAGEVQRALESALPFPCEDSTLIGVAGTATTLALLAQGRQSFDPAAVTNFRLPIAEVDRLFRLLRQMSARQILKLTPILAGRADIITAGALILHEVMSRFGFTEMIVSERGLRHGLALREWERKRS
jgi:exopolyphosphatase/guanosine-5'-triphosphate,3'-diphosphate pyrophosphatase